MLPNFLIIGAARSGTTSLYSALQSHPDVYLPINKRPEPHFFLKDAEFATGVGYYEQRFFAGWSGQRAVGEASTSYLFGAEVPARVKRIIPDVKLICVLRNPIDRAFSSYWHTVRSGLEALPFEQALEQETTRKRELAGTAMGEIAPFAYVERGLYHEQLTRWLAEFPRGQFAILLFEDLLADPRSALQAVARILGIDAAGFPDRPFERENQSVPDDAAIMPATYAWLADRFRDDVASLETLLGRNLQHWLAAPAAHPVVR